MKASKTRNELKASGSSTYPLKTKERMKNDEKSSWNHPRKCLRSVMEAPRLVFSSRKHVFSSKTIQMHSIGVRTLLLHLFALIYSQNGEELAAQLAQACLGFLKKFPDAPSKLLSSPPFLYFMEKFRKPYGSISDLIFLFFLFHFTNLKWNMLTQGFRKFYGSIMKAPQAIL